MAFKESGPIVLLCRIRSRRSVHNRPDGSQGCGPSGAFSGENVLTSSQPQDPRRYWAFISYSHHDSHAAIRLHRRLEAYRVPRHLVGRSTASGAVPKRLQPIFRDRDELPSSAELGGVIRQALSESRHLIVICSPSAAASRWVDEEIRLFKAMGGGDRILALIVDGEPHAADPSRECFPPALLESEPIAADLRKSGDGPFLARMKLLAGLLGLGLDELVRRERRRQREQSLIRGGVLAVFALLIVVAMTVQRRDFDQREQLEYRRQLVEHGRRELLAESPMRAAVYLAEAYRRGEDSLALRYMLQRAMQPIDALRQVLNSNGVPWRSFLTEDDALLTVVGQDGWIDVWSLEQGRRLAHIEDAAIAARNFVKREEPALSHDRRLLSVAVVNSKTLQGHRTVWSIQDQRRLLDVAVDPFDPASVQPFGPDGELLAIAPGGKPRLWSIADGAFRSIDVDGEVTLSTFDRSGRWMAFGKRSGEVELRSRQPGGRSLRLRGLSRPVVLMVFDDDSGRLLAAGEDGSVRGWTLPNGELVFASGHSQQVTFLDFSRDRERFLTAAADGLRIWRSRDGSLLYSGASPDSKPFSLGPDGAQFAQIVPGGAQVVDVQTNESLLRLEGNILNVLLSNRGRQLLTVNASGQIARWRADQRPLGQRWHGDRPESSRVFWRNSVDFALLPDGRIVSGGLDGRPRIWRSSALEPLASLDPLGDAISRVSASADGERVAVSTISGVIEVWNPQTQERLRRFELPGRFISNLRLSPDGRHLFAADRGNTGHLWNVDSGEHRAQYVMDSRFALDISGDSRWLAIPVQRRTLVIDLLTLESRLEEPLVGDAEESPEIGCLRFAPDGRALVAMASESDEVGWISLHSPQRYHMHLPDAGGCFAAKFSPDGQRILLLDQARTSAAIWEPAQGRIGDLAGHTKSVFDADWSPDGRFLVTGGSDGQIKLWDAQSLLLIDDIGSHMGAISTISFSPDGRTLYSSGVDDGRLQAWPFGLENRTAGEIAGRVNCVSPWTLENNALLPKSVDLQRCLEP
ncbi:toll/interleukin-1 receptor domain-containing protein [Hydrocarboniphaga effusa]|uniref:toll/interleukin-1 receptor domain-containing protein n=1 Tax=Hydrocarboniphaga effusa TaxID=243629 RepID=UPI003BAB3AF2